MQIYKALQFPSTNKDKKNPLKKKERKRKKGLIGDKVKIENAELKEIKRIERVWNDNREEKIEREREREKERERERDDTCYNWAELLKSEKLLQLNGIVGGFVKENSWL